MMDDNTHSTQRIGFGRVCRDFMKNQCKRTICKFIHYPDLCTDYWENNCYLGDSCKKSHKIPFDIIKEHKRTFNNKKEQTDNDIQRKKVQKEQKDNNNQMQKDQKDNDNQRQKDHRYNTKQSHNKNKNEKRKKPKNTECFTPMTTPVDMRIVFELNKETCNAKLTSRDVLVAPNIFSEYENGELYKRLMQEINNCKVPREQLLKMWHGNDKIDGTHLIINDRTKWKEECPTFLWVVDRIKKYFKMDVQATRFNWYKDTSQWKPFHHDSAYVNPEKAAVQNFTVAVSFGVERDAAFEHATTKTVISLPHGDGCAYAFSKDTNCIWRHGILQDLPTREDGRISVICWGWVDNQIELV